MKKRTTIFIDPELEARLRRYAEREGKSAASVVREALATYLDTRVAGGSGVPGLAGRFESGKTDTSERVDDLLWRDPHE